MTEGITKKSLILILVVLVAGLVVVGTVLAENQNSSGEPTITPLVTGLGSTAGSTIGPGGDLYVTENIVGADGKILRIDPQTGEVTEFASGLPQAPIPLGGVVDVAFLDDIAYALVTVVGDPIFGSSDPSGIYRVEGDCPSNCTLIADIGMFSMNDVPDNTPILLTTGVQYALETFRDGFLVTDGHHNRVLRVTVDGEITEMAAFGNVVPTGLEVHGNTIYMAEAGPLPHLPQSGKIVSFAPNSPDDVTEVATGARLNVDVEFGRGRTLFALSQGFWSGGPEDAGTPAQPNTGSLFMANEDGTFTTVADGLNQPNSMEIIGNTAYVVTLNGEVWQITNIANPPYGN